MKGIAILNNIQARDIPLLLKSRAHFHDELGSPDHCSKPPDIKTRGHFRTKFAKEKFCFKHKLWCFRWHVPQNGIDVAGQTERTFSIPEGRQ